MLLTTPPMPVPRWNSGATLSSPFQNLFASAPRPGMGSGLIVFPGHHGATSFNLSYKSILGTRKEIVSARTLWLSLENLKSE